MLRLGSAIRRVRAARGFTQKELAARCRITPSFLSLVEADKRVASMLVVQRVAEALSVHPQVLLWEAFELPDNLTDQDRQICEIAKAIVRRVTTHEESATND